MESLHSWLDEYPKSHQKKTNKLIHWICVPAIFFSILSLLSSVEIYFLIEWLPIEFSNLASIFVVLALIFTPDYDSQWR